MWPRATDPGRDLAGGDAAGGGQAEHPGAHQYRSATEACHREIPPFGRWATWPVHLTTSVRLRVARPPASKLQTSTANANRKIELFRYGDTRRGRTRDRLHVCACT